MPPTKGPTAKKLLARDYVFRGTIYEAGVRDVPADFPHGTAVGASADGGVLPEAAAQFLVALPTEQLPMALALRGITAPTGATRAQMLALVGLGDAPQAPPAPPPPETPAMTPPPPPAVPETAAVVQSAPASAASAIPSELAPAPSAGVGGPDAAPQADVTAPAPPAEVAPVAESRSEYEAQDKADLEALIDLRRQAGEAVPVTPTGAQERPRKSDLVAALVAADAAKAKA